MENPRSSLPLWRTSRSASGRKRHCARAKNVFVWRLRPQRCTPTSGMLANSTERKRAEQAQRESEDKLRLLLDSTAEAIYGIDLEYRCTFCNLACLRALGYERIDEVVGKNMHDLMHHTRADGTLFP